MSFEIIFVLLGLIGMLVALILDKMRPGIVLLSLVVALVIIMVVSNPFMGLVYSQMVLSIQLPVTIFLQVYLTSSERVMGIYKNKVSTKYMLYMLGGIVSALNVALLASLIWNF